MQLLLPKKCFALKETKPKIYVEWKDLETNQQKGSDALLALGWGYACLSRSDRRPSGSCLMHLTGTHPRDHCPHKVSEAHQEEKYLEIALPSSPLQSSSFLTHCCIAKWVKMRFTNHFSNKSQNRAQYSGLSLNWGFNHLIKLPRGFIVTLSGMCLENCQSKANQKAYSKNFS